VQGKDGEAVSYTRKGKVQAYVQFSQTIPEGFERINLWPVHLFDQIAVPNIKDITKLPVILYVLAG